MVKLNLGGGYQKLIGYTNIDRVFGQEAYPLAVDDGSVDEIRASHILEHFPHNDTGKIVKHWADKLKLGGVLKIAVPDFKWIAENYLSGKQQNVAGFVMGGQQHKDDFHQALFDEGRLTEIMADAGLTDIRRWTSEIYDCAAEGLSLNLAGTKPILAVSEKPHMLEVKAKICALMSVPRLGWQDNFGSCFKALKDSKFDIPLYRWSGAFWEMGIQRGLNAAIEDGVDWVITIDYDTVFDSSDVEELLTLAAMYPEADCIIPLQAKRGGDVMLFTMKDSSGNMRHNADMEEFEKDLTPIHTGHFGLTLIKTAALKKMPKPWLRSIPTDEGEWDEGRIDADIYFWQQAEKYGLGVFQANHIRIGHLQVVVSWVNKDFGISHCYVGDYNQHGKPEGVK